MTPLDIYLPHDKLLHILAGVLVYAVFHFISPLVGLLMVGVVAIGKEAYDYLHQDKHTTDVWDFLATCAGGLLGFICSL